MVKRAKRTTTDDWHAANQRYLMEALDAVREMLRRHVEADSKIAYAHTGSVVDPALNDTPAALDTLCDLFGLTDFERSVLLLCAGVELDTRFAALCASAQGENKLAHPTFSLALAALPNPYWAAMSPTAPLRHWRLIELAEGSALTASALRIDERILNYLTGVRHLDERIARLVNPLDEADELVPSHRLLAERMTGIWSRSRANSSWPALELCGENAASKRSVATGVAELLGLDLVLMSAHMVPSSPSEVERLIRLWQREAALSGCVLLLDCDQADPGDQARERTLDHVVQQLCSPLLVTSRQRRHSPQQPLITFEVNKPTSAEQREVWRSALETNTADLQARIEQLVSQFHLSASSIRAASAGALGESGNGKITLPRALWDNCRRQARARLEDLAQRIEPAATWDDLVLPRAQRQMIEDIEAHVRHRTQVHEQWGFAKKGARGLGLAALFAGTSGTGKTMAAEVLAGDLELDLYRIDLSQVVNKYIGETEKNLARVFDAAEEGGAILVFDEADALFGKRSEVKDSHDRYANIEVSFLLQRMESYRGLAVLTTNIKDALDRAFLRRLRFVVQFPFPDAEERAQIWRRIFPDETPTEDLDSIKLGRLNVAGGNIRNIALHAAFLAAEDSSAVTMTHLLHAARSEYSKLDKPLTSEEIRGWA